MDVRSPVLAAFETALEDERCRTAERRDRAASQGVVRDRPYARERSLAEAGAALADVPAVKWFALGDWLARNALGLDVSPIKDRPRDRRGSWVSAEADALRAARAELGRARQALAECLSVRGLDAAGLTTGFPEGADLLGRLGPRYLDAVEAAERALAEVGRAEQHLSDEAEPEGEVSPGDWAEWEPYGETAPGDGRHPAGRAFPELMRFWTADAGRDANQRELFLTFARAALSAVAEAKGDGAAEWTVGIDEAFKRR